MHIDLHLIVGRNILLYTSRGRRGHAKTLSLSLSFSSPHIVIILDLPVSLHADLNLEDVDNGIILGTCICLNFVIEQLLFGITLVSYS